MGCVDYSLFDLLKVGPGPSSSHTIAPMRAGYDFLFAVRGLLHGMSRQSAGLEVVLQGSLAATGRGHKTDKAVLAGLLGYQPEASPPYVLGSLLVQDNESYVLDLGGKQVSLSAEDIVFDCQSQNLPCNNTLLIRLSGEGRVIFQREYHSVGGGFLHWEGKEEQERNPPVYCYENGKQLKRILHENGITLHDLILENEKSVSGLSREQTLHTLDSLLQVMEKAVQRGLSAEGVLPGNLGLHRKARPLYERAMNMDNPAGRFTTSLCAYAFAVSEENASGQPVVTAPTCGSAGVVPAIYMAMKHHLGFEQEAIRRGLLAAAAIGLIVKHNASISGADVGCQGEVGVASAMAAAMLTYAHSMDIEQTENAAESALEHHLGLTCDPVGGYVQIPCIERNAMAAVKAHAAYRIATTEISHFHKVELDSVIEVMNETGRDMSPKYRETSTGGLATRVKCE